MLHTFRADHRFRSRIELALHGIEQSLAEGPLATLDTKTLRRVDSDEQRSGSKPLLTLRSEDGKAYAFKQCEPPLAAAEEAAYRLRRLGRRPAVPARALSLDLDGSGAFPGLLKPFVEFNVSAELESDTTTWTPEQRAVMLLEHAWEWFLDNLDTNTSQYALMGPLKLPVNIDWDRAFFSDGRSELSRFAKYKPALPNARTFLYADYVAGKIELPLWLLADEARRIRRLPKAEVKKILAHYASIRFESETERERFVARARMRQRGIEREVAVFMRLLWSERRSLQHPAGGAGEWLRRRLIAFWADWQRVLNAVLRGPIGVGARRAVSLFRGFRVKPSATPEGTDKLPTAELDVPPKSA